MTKFNHSISVVVPVYNAEKTLDELINKLLSVLSYFNDYRIILVDDASMDQSFSLMRKWANKNHLIIAIKLCQNYGQQRAIFAGLKYAKGDFTVIIDDDLQQQPDDILKLYKAIWDGYDVVYGINKVAYQNKTIRRLGSSLRNFVFDKVTNKPKEIRVCSFRMMNHKTVGQVIQSNYRFVYISMEILKHTNNIGNVLVEYASNDQSNYHLGKLIRLLLRLTITYSPLKIFEIFKQYGNDCEYCEIINEVKS